MQDVTQSSFASVRPGGLGSVSSLAVTTLLLVLLAGTDGGAVFAASWGPYDLTNSRSIYSPSNQSASLRTGWYSTTAGTGAARSVLKASDIYMAHMPDASLVTGSTFTVAFTQTGTYSRSADNPLNIYRISQTWDPTSVNWASPWGAGGAYSGVGTSAQSVVYPAEGTVYTFSAGAGYNFPYGVLMKGNTESSITYRKAWLGSGPYPTLTVNYNPPSGTANAVIRSWAYLGWFDQLSGDTSDTGRQTRLDTDQVSGTYDDVSITQTTMAPCVDGTTYGNSYGSRQWKQGTMAADVVDLNSANFYNAVHEYAVTYCFVYVYNSKGSSISNAYLGIGSDDGCRVWWNGSVVNSFVGGRGAAADANFWGPITINSGWNRLLVKVENGGTGHGVYARFANVNRTALTDKSYLSFYTNDATAPSTPTSLAVSGVTSGAWQNSVAAPTFTWTSGTDSQGSGEGVSGVRGQRYYFGTSSSGDPATFQTGVSYAPGSQSSGTYYFRVGTVDAALNESSPATFTFKYDGIAPSAVTSFSSSAPGSDDAAWYNTTGNLVWTWAAATDAHSGLDGYAIVQDQDADTQPDPSKTHDDDVTSYTLSGPQSTGEYWLHVRSKDNAGNWDAAGDTQHRRIRIDRTAPTDAALSVTTVAADSIAVGGSGTDANAGVSSSSGFRYSRSGADPSSWTGTSYTWTNLAANTSYTLGVTVRDQAEGGANTADSSTATVWTLSVPPDQDSVSSGQTTFCVGDNAIFSAVGGFGAGKVASYRYAWTQSDTYSFTGTENSWSSGTLSLQPTASGDWYLHVQGLNGANAANGTYTYAVTVLAETEVVNDPQDANIVENGQAQFTAAGTGAGDVGYQWQLYDAQQGQWADLEAGDGYTGVGTSTLTISGVTDADSGLFRCNITGTCGQVSTQEAELTVAPTAAAWYSVKVHGTAGEFAVPITASGGIEPRRGNLTIRVAFDKSVMAVDGSVGTDDVLVTDDAEQVISPSAVALVDAVEGVGQTLEVTVPEASATGKRLTLTLGEGKFRRPTSTKALLAGTRQWQVRCLVGDVNKSGSVNTTDMSIVRDAVNTGGMLTQANCIYDVNLSGTMTIVDMALVKSNVGASVP